MTEFPFDIVTFLILNATMRQDYHQAVVKRAMDHRKQASRTARQRLDKAIKAHVEVRGFRDPIRAPTPLLLQEVLDASYHADALLGAILEVWVESHADLQVAVREYLSARDIPVVEATEMKDGFPGGWTSTEMFEVADEFQAQHPDFDEDDVALMLCCMTGRAPLPDEMVETLTAAITEKLEEPETENTPEKGVTALRWEQWLEELRALPADAPEWETVAEFTEAVRQLAEEKSREREATRDKLQQALATLVKQAEDALDFFDMTDVVTWTAEACPLTEAAALAEQVEQLQEALMRHQDIYRQPATTLAEDRQRRKELDEIEDEIFQLHARLAPALTPSPPLDKPPESQEGPPEDEEPPEEPEPPAPEHPSPEAMEATETIAESVKDISQEDLSGPPELEHEPPVEDDRYEEAISTKPPTVPAPPAEEPIAPEAEEGRAVTPVTEPTVKMPPGELVVSPEEATAPTEEKVAEPTEDSVAPTPPAAPAPLRSSQKVADLLQSDDRDENWHALLWALIAEDDLPAAYWLARSLTDSDRNSPIPAWLLAAAQGARWLSPDSEEFVSDLFEIAQSYQPASDDAQALVGLAVALRPTLIAPFTGLMDWLKVPVCCPLLHDLVTAVRGFASLGIALRPEDLLGVTGADQREAALIDAAQAAERWLDNALARRTKFKRSSDVWRYLVGPRGDLRTLLLPVSKDRRAEIEHVRQRLYQWQQPDYVSDQIDQIDRELVRIRTRPIVGGPRQYLLRSVGEACSLAKRWCKLVEREREIETRGDWLFEQVARLRTGVQKALPDVEVALHELSSPAQPAPLAAPALCLRRAVKQLRGTLNLPPETTEPEPLMMTPWDWLPLDAENLSIALSRRLLWLPEVTLDEDGLPPEATLHLIAPALRIACVQGRSLQVAFDGWLQKQDYRFIERLSTVTGNETDAAKLSRHYHEALDGSRAALRDNIAETESAIEQAVVDGIIAEERSEYSATVVAVDPEEVLNFPPRFEELRKVRENLSAARQKRLSELRAEWQDLQSRLTASPIEPAKQKQLSDLVTTALDHDDTRVVEEYLARLTEVLDLGGDAKDLEGVSFRPTDQREMDYLNAQAEFLRMMPALESGVKEGLPAAINAVRSRRKFAGLSFRRLPKERLQEATRALEAWRQLKQGGAWKPDTTRHIQTILRFLGFTFESGGGTAVRIEESGAYWAYARAMMSASVLLTRPIPQFGSQAQGHYDLICVWERPSVDTMSAWLHDLRLDARSILVFYLGRMSAAHRRVVTGTARERELAMAVLDETLLLYLASEHRARLPIFLRCALPFAAANPYTPFQAGDVPPEMFFGRESMARELQRPAGSCLVYGGRQLGKSALLRHVQREFHHPEREQYVWVEDIKLVGDLPAGQPTHAVWSKLRDGFKRLGVLSQRVITEKPEEVRRHILKAMEQEPDRRVLVLLDEADKFLEADSSDNFSVVEALRTLMLTTQYRFKVVFAGLHNVQRFQGIPNQPLAHFGAPQCVGPLEPDAAQRLVRQPLEALGYRFTDDATVLRILSYTNYHPGLIQLFCQELLKRLHVRAGSSLPPYHIEQSDVEAVYRVPEVRERIRERFDWTLALDMRYQAVAWSLIVDQMEMRDSYAQAYPPDEILGLVREWWPQGFSDVGTYHQLRSLLDEMCGLGVLVRNADGHYRLRSPNLVRLMGTEDEIQNRLLELLEKEPPATFDADNHHAPLDDAARRYSPLTYAQERSLNPARPGVGLVFASEALGLSALPEAFKRFIPPGLPENRGTCTEIPSRVTNGERLRNWLDRRMHTHSSHERVVVYHRPAKSDPENLESLVRGALSFCRHHQSPRRRTRVLFVFDPQATWVWLSLPQSIREQLETGADAVVFPQRWNLVGVRQRLAQHDKMHSDEVCQEVLQATGGWPCLLDELFNRCDRRDDDPRPFVKEIERELMDPTSQLREQFRQSLGLGNENGIVNRVLAFTLREREVPIDLMTPELIGGEPALTPEECARAVEYLQRMGCVDLHGDTVLAERVVRDVLSQP